MNKITRLLIETAKKLQLTLSNLVDAIRDSNKRDHGQEKEGYRNIDIRIHGELTAKLKTDEASEHPNNARRNAEFWPQWITAISTALAFAAAAVYAGETSCIVRTTNQTYSEIQKQTAAIQCTAKAAEDQARLTRQQLEGTMRAVIDPGFGINMDSGQIEIAPKNNGRDAAREIIISGEVLKISIPKLAPIGAAVPIYRRIPIMAAEQQNPDRSFTRIPISAAERTQMRGWLSDLGIEIRGTVSYFDGFGQWSEPICQIKWGLKTDKGSSSAEATGCEEFKKVLPSLLGQKR